MKKIYLTLTLLFCVSIYAQEETQLFGDWYLQSRTDNDVTIYPPLTTEENYNIILNFGLEPPSSGNPLVVNSHGPATDSFYGNFLVENSTILFNNIYETLGNFCDHPPEVCGYFDSYNYNLLFDNNTATQDAQYLVSYEITGIGNDAVLTITNNFNGDYAVYGRQTLSNNSFTNKPISVFPNPVNTTLNVSNLDLESTYSIYSIDGKEVIADSKLKSSINTSNLKSGIYFLKIDNKQIIKFIKQ